MGGAGGEAFVVGGLGDGWYSGCGIFVGSGFGGLVDSDTHDGFAEIESPQLPRVLTGRFAPRSLGGLALLGLPDHAERHILTDRGRSATATQFRPFSPPGAWFDWWLFSAIENTGTDTP